MCIDDGTSSPLSSDNAYGNGKPRNVYFPQSEGKTLALRRVVGHHKSKAGLRQLYSFFSSRYISRKRMKRKYIKNRDFYIRHYEERIKRPRDNRTGSQERGEILPSAIFGFLLKESLMGDSRKDPNESVQLTRTSAGIFYLHLQHSKNALDILA